MASAARRLIAMGLGGIYISSNSYIKIMLVSLPALSMCLGGGGGHMYHGYSFEKKNNMLSFNT